MGTLRVSFWQQVVVSHAPYGTQSNGRASFYFILIPSIVSLFLYCSLYPSFQSSFFFSSRKIPTPAIPMHILQSSLISSLSSEWFSYGHRWHCSTHSFPPISLVQNVIYVHPSIHLCFYFICLFGCCGQNIQDISKIRLEYTIHINLRNIVILLKP